MVRLFDQSAIDIVPAAGEIGLQKAHDEALAALEPDDHTLPVDLERADGEDKIDQNGDLQTDAPGAVLCMICGGRRQVVG